jgi:hypothetical protein
VGWFSFFFTLIVYDGYYRNESCELIIYLHLFLQVEDIESKVDLLIDMYKEDRKILLQCVYMSNTAGSRNCLPCAKTWGQPQFIFGACPCCSSFYFLIFVCPFMCPCSEFRVVMSVTMFVSCLLPAVIIVSVMIAWHFYLCFYHDIFLPKLNPGLFLFSRIW